MPHRIIDAFLNDAWGKPGLGFTGFGILLNVVSRQDLSFYASMISVGLGIIYYILKIISEFIRKK